MLSAFPANLFGAGRSYTMNSLPLILCGAFYALLCVFSIVTGIIYFSGKRELNPLELSDSFVKKLDTAEKRQTFAQKMGLVTFVVGIVQGITAYCAALGNSPLHYWIALGFTIFSIGSVSVKLKGKINLFPILKSVAYVTILAVLLLKGSRTFFF